MNANSEREDFQLINSSNNHQWRWKLKNRYTHTLVTSKLAILCLVWSAIIMSQYLLVKVALHVHLVHDFQLRGIHAACLLVTYFAYPVFGYLGEKWTRYYVIIIGALISCCASILLQLVSILEKVVDLECNSKLYYCLIAIGVFFGSLGLGLFTANIIQFSTNQIEHASSKQLASFARWWVFAIFTSSCILEGLFFPLSKKLAVRYVLLVISFFLTVVSVMIGICFKSKFEIEPPPNIDPLKLVYQVFKYAWKHKYPERRSAFTFSDKNYPSRLDLGKSRYGGPFTTDQVESVKSFGNVLAILLSCTLFSYYASIDPAYLYEYKISLNGTVTFCSPVLVPQYFHSTDLLIVVIMIPLLQLIVVPFFPRLVLGMMKRIWLGLFLMVASFLVVTINIFMLVEPELAITAYQFNTTIFIVNMINTIGSALIIFSSLEFILAQAPCQMQGLLIGVWSIQFGGEAFHVFTMYFFYFFTTFLLFCSLVVYSILMFWYKYRLRNEPSDINVKQRVEEVYERDLERERILSEELSFSTTVTIETIS